MPRERRYSNVGGMICNVSPYLLKEGECSLMLNTSLDVIGKWQKRDGTQIYGSSLTASNPCLGLHQFNTYSNTGVVTEYQLCVFSNNTNNVIYEITSSTLNGAITTSSTSIVLTDATNFASSGTVEISGDLITYTGKAVNTLTGVTGIAVAHANTTTVRQWKSALATDTDDKKTRFANFIGRVFRVNGANAMNGSTDTATWNTTNCFAVANYFPSLIEIFQDRIYLSGFLGSAGLDDRLVGSSIVDSTGNTISWTSADTTHITAKTGNNGFYIDINPEDSQVIKALKRSGATLLIFKERSLYTWDGKSTQPDTLIDVGTISQETVTNIHNMTFFIGRSKKDLGIYVFTGGYPKLISRKIKKWTDAITQTSANFDNMCVGGDDTHFYAYVGNVVFTNDDLYGTRTFNDVWLVYNIPYDSWTVYDNLPARIFGNLVESSAEKLYFGDNNGKIWEFGAGESDDSGDAKTPIDLEIITKDDPFDSPEIGKELIGVGVVADKAQSTTVKYRFDHNGEFKSLGSLKKRFTYLDAPHKSGFERFGNSIEFQFTDNSQYQTSIMGFSLDLQIEEDIRKNQRGNE